MIATIIISLLKLSNTFDNVDQIENLYRDDISSLNENSDLWLSILTGAVVLIIIPLLFRGLRKFDKLVDNFENNRIVNIEEHNAMLLKTTQIETELMHAKEEHKQIHENKKNIDELDEKVNQHEIEIKIIKNKVK